MAVQKTLPAPPAVTGRRHPASTERVSCRSSRSQFSRAPVGDPARPDTRGAPSRAALTIVSGNNQSGEVGTVLREPLVVRVTDALGAPATGIPVTFIREYETIASTTTDALGLASVQ